MLQSRLFEVLSEVPDPRRAQGKRYQLPAILVFCVLATLAGARSYRQIHSFMKLHRDRLTELFELRWRRVPAYTTVRDIIRGVDVEALEGVFRKYSRELWLRSNDGLALVAIDGKTLRRSYDHINDQRAAHVVSAFAGDGNLILGHLEVTDKSNEIPAARKLINDLGLKGCLITMDAMHCQKNSRRHRQDRKSGAGTGQGKSAGVIAAASPTG